ncbi:hypothetical protein Agub_g11419 [Astrephomene gubernaculifera]|uniref:tRNA/rRNA methyltransferase SpoU type domain-containing protein n=1 Tax=Astrephomene gubernaculifera TaxID=47775 RepID=A0AAD3DWN6_9CHLO|nr:hypothetical protein Agub_g11419 [Astrephomene gubernaculifera]
MHRLLHSMPLGMGQLERPNGCHISGLRIGATHRTKRAIGVNYASPVICNSDARGRTKWYGTYTEEQYLAQRQSEEREKWAASVRSLTGNLSQTSWDASPLADPPALLAGVTVVLMSPRKPVSVGTVARACGSFECEDMRIVMPRQDSYITRRHAKSASKGAQYILYGARHFDSIEEATADCDVRIAFTRWSQASSPHVYKVDINGLTSHPAVRRVLTQPLTAVDGGANNGPAVQPSSFAVPGEAEAEGASSTPGTASSSSPSSSSSSSSSAAAAANAGEESRHVGDLGQTVRSSCCGGGTSSTSTSSSSASSSMDQDSSTSSSSSSTSGQQPPQQLPTSGSPAPAAPKIALVFGREELGMSDEEVDGCEVCCSVPIGRLQESLSLSHAVSIALCALYQTRLQFLTSSSSSSGSVSSSSSSSTDSAPSRGCCSPGSSNSSSNSSSSSHSSSTGEGVRPEDVAAPYSSSGLGSYTATTAAAAAAAGGGGVTAGTAVAVTAEEAPPGVGKMNRRYVVDPSTGAIRVAANP